MPICFFLRDMTGSCYEIISLGGSNAEAAFRLPSSWPLSALTFGMPFSAMKVRASRNDRICTGIHRQPRNLGQVGWLPTWLRFFTVGPLFLKLPYLRLLVLPLSLAFNHGHHGQLITTFLLLWSLPLIFCSSSVNLFSSTFEIPEDQSSRKGRGKEEWGWGLRDGGGAWQSMPASCLFTKSI